MEAKEYVIQCNSDSWCTGGDVGQSDSQRHYKMEND